MPIQEFVWSLVAPVGFLSKEYADNDAYQEDITAGNVQDPRAGLGWMLYPSGVAKPPVKIVYAPAIGGAPVYDFEMLQVSDDGPVTGQGWVTYFWANGTTNRTISGKIAKNLPDGLQIVRAIAEDGRQATTTIVAAGNLLESPPPPEVSTWEDLVEVLVDDEADTAAFMKLHKIHAPHGWATMKYSKKIAWLKAYKTKA